MPHPKLLFTGSAESLPAMTAGLMETDEMELDTLGDRKTALFVIISDTDDTFTQTSHTPNQLKTFKFLALDANIFVY